MGTRSPFGSPLPIWPPLRRYLRLTPTLNFRRTRARRTSTRASRSSSAAKQKNLRLLHPLDLRQTLTLNAGHKMTNPRQMHTQDRRHAFTPNFGHKLQPPRQKHTQNLRKALTQDLRHKRHRVVAP